MSLHDDRGQATGPWGKQGGRPPVDPILDDPSRQNPRFARRLLVLGIIVIIGLVGLFQIFPPAFIREGDEVSFVQYGLIGTVLLMSLAGSRRSLLGMAGHLAVWAAIVLAIVALYGYRYELREVGERVMAELVPTRGGEIQGGAMVFTRSADRQFWIDATVDGVQVRFLVDTGASTVVLNRSDATRLGFRPGNLAFTQDFQTANGRTRGAPVTLKEIRIGTIRFDNVAASVNEGELDHSLLGMRVLERLSSLEIRKDRLIIRP
jgi:aspartyl protease family protein